MRTIHGLAVCGVLAVAMTMVLPACDDGPSTTSLDARGPDLATTGGAGGGSQTGGAGGNSQVGTDARLDTPPTIDSGVPDEGTVMDAAVADAVLQPDTADALAATCAPPAKKCGNGVCLGDQGAGGCIALTADVSWLGDCDFNACLAEDASCKKNKLRRRSLALTEKDPLKAACQPELPSLKASLCADPSIRARTAAGEKVDVYYYAEQFAADGQRTFYWGMGIDKCP